MVLIQSLVLTGLLLWAGHGFLRRHAVLCYVIACLLSLGTIALVWSGSVPDTRWIVPMFTQGGLAGGLFIAVMFAGAVPSHSRFYRLVIPIRGELSILASILTLGHNIAFGKTYFLRLFSGAAMAWNLMAAAVCSLLMIAIMLPLFITSFRRVRRRMKGRSWKRLQRLAYGFYGLMYVHVLLLNFPAARLSAAAKLNIVLYSIVFLTYACMRTRKAVSRISHHAAAKLPLLFGLVFAALCLAIWLPQPAPEPAGTTGYADGTYTGTGMGFNGSITVSVTIEGGRMTDIRVLSAADDDEFFLTAESAIIPAALEAQSAEVDAASGATYSSAGLKAAISNALKAAQGEA